MNKRVIAAFLILLLLVVPNISGVFGAPDDSAPVSTETAPETVAATEAAQAPTETTQAAPEETEAPVETQGATQAPAETTAAAETEAPSPVEEETQAPEEETEAQTLPEGALALPAAGGVLESGTYFLTQDLTLQAALEVTSGSTVELNLNGHTLTGGASIEYLISNLNGAVLNIHDGAIRCAKHGIESWGTLSLTNVDLSARNDTLNLYTGTIDVASCQIKATAESGGMAIYTNKDSSCALTIRDCRVEASCRALNQWGTGTVEAYRTVFVSQEEDVLETNNGTVKLFDHCQVLYGDVPGKYGGKKSSFDFDSTTVINESWDLYHNSDWLSYVKEKYNAESYPNGIPASEFVRDDAAKTIYIYTADGFAWWASLLDTNTEYKTNLQDYRVLLERSIDLGSRPWRFSLQTADFQNGCLDGQNHTISNLTVYTSHNDVGTAGYGLIGDTSSNAGPITICNLQFDKAKIRAVTGGGVVLGYLSCPGTLENIHVTNSYVYGHMIGGLIGSIDDKASAAEIKSCTVSDVTVETSGWNGGGLVGRYTASGTLTITDSHVSDISIKALVHAGGLLGLAEVNSKVVLDKLTTVSNVTLSRKGEYIETHTVSTGGIGNANNVPDRNDYILDGTFAGGYYSSCAAVSYAEYYIKSYSTKWDAATYRGFVQDGLFTYQLTVRNSVVGYNEERVGSDNYDFTTHVTKPSVIYYAVYNDGTNSRDVLYGYEYVATNEAAAGKTLYGDLDCTRVPWYTDRACTQAYDLSTPVTGGVTLYTPLVLRDQNGPISADRLQAVAGGLPKLQDSDGVFQTTDWTALQQGKTFTPANADQIPDMCLELYASVDAIERTLTVTRTQGTGEQSFWYTITGGGLRLEVCIPQGKDSVTVSGLRANVTYTVTEQTGWSWRYAADSAKTVRFENDQLRQTVSFAGGRTAAEWLSGLASLLKRGG